MQMPLTRYRFATHLKYLARYLPSVISQPALRIVDDLLYDTGCAGEIFSTNLAVARYDRAFFVMRNWDFLVRVATTASVQDISSVAAVEQRSISEMRTARERMGILKSTLLWVREQILEREADATLGALMTLESGRTKFSHA